MYLLKIKKLVAALLALIITATFCGCSNVVDTQGDGDKPQTEIDENAARVTFLDVGNGECSFIRFPDGKTMLIDCGAESKNVTEKISKILSDECDGKLDYFLYTHPDFEHVGNAEYVLENAKVGTLFIPKIIYPNTLFFPEYLDVKTLAENKGITIVHPDMYKSIKGDGYVVVFLTPEPFSGSYDKINVSDSPTESEINNVSPIVYMEINRARFMFTGDAEQAEEQTVMDFYGIGFYANLYRDTGVNVNLEDVDYLKVAGGGFNQGSTQDFLLLLRAKTAVISVAGNNYNGYPTSTVLKRIQNANENYRIVRTDVSGTFNVYVNPDGKIIETTGD